MTYNTIFYKNKIKNPKNHFPTQEIRAKGFAREVKSLVLNKDISECQIQPEHEIVLNALNKGVNSSLLLPEEYKKRIKNQDFVSISRLSDWWNGKGFPTKKNKEVIEILYPNLSTKWFQRDKIINRFQLHLATLDIYYIDSKNSKYAANEANDLLDKITEDWRPKENSHTSGGYLVICGPKERGNTNFKHYELLSSFNSSVKHSPDYKKIKKESKVRYDLSIDTPSYVGIHVGEEISNIYQKSVPLSIIPYMFCLLCLSKNDESNYKNDLFLDFLSALNCASFFLNKKYGGVYDLHNDKYFGYVYSTPRNQSNFSESLISI